MSSKPESTFIGAVHRHLPTSLYRMKNHNEYASGVADCWYSGNKADLWIEYKFLVVPKRDGTVISFVEGKDPPLSHLQQHWLESRHAESRKVGVIVGCKEGGVWFPGVSWSKNLTTADFKKHLVSRKSLADMIVSIVM